MEMSGQLHAPAAFCQRKEPGIDWIGGLVGPKVKIDTVENF
jgi:hypothetical protein